MQDKGKLMKVLFVLAILACVYVGTLIVSEVKGLKFIGGGTPASNVISFEGKGEVSAKPDVAEINFTITDNQKEMKDAQTKVTEKETAVLAFLDKSGIAKKDIKTEGYNSYPKYDYVTPCYRGYGMPCSQAEPKITGYEVSENITVKVRDLTKAGDVVKGIGAIGVSNLSGPNFAVENEDALKAQARKIAIEEAKEKAKKLSKDLGVNLVRIVNFSENGNYPVPMYASGMMAKDTMAVVESAPSPELPTGENKITSNVTITYEIR